MRAPHPEGHKMCKILRGAVNPHEEQEYSELRTNPHRERMETEEGLEWFDDVSAA